MPNPRQLAPIVAHKTGVLLLCQSEIAELLPSSSVPSPALALLPRAGPRASHVIGSKLPGQALEGFEGFNIDVISLVDLRVWCLMSLVSRGSCGCATCDQIHCRIRHRIFLGNLELGLLCCPVRAAGLMPFCITSTASGMAGVPRVLGFQLDPWLRLI